MSLYRDHLQPTSQPLKEKPWDCIHIHLGSNHPIPRQKPYKSGVNQWPMTHHLWPPLALEIKGLKQATMIRWRLRHPNHRGTSPALSQSHSSTNVPLHHFVASRRGRRAEHCVVEWCEGGDHPRDHSDHMGHRDIDHSSLVRV